MPDTNRRSRTERHVIYKVNRRMVIFTLGQIELLEAVLLLLPALTALIYKEKCLWAILITAGVCGVLGGLFTSPLIIFLILFIGEAVIVLCRK